MELSHHICIAVKDAGLLPTGAELDPEKVASWMQDVPKNMAGDIALPCFPLAKLVRKAPPLIAKAIAAQLDNAVAVGPYVNFTL